MRILDRIKQIWNRLGEPDIEVTEADVNGILEAEGLIGKKGNKKPVVERVETTPVSRKILFRNQQTEN